ncbi:hypothetical protein KAU11_05510, partial [Candidatus Babeliales bacterium]|nr:hypothetical protein [Candidatus Babeliales bacterium]
KKGDFKFMYPCAFCSKKIDIAEARSITFYHKLKLITVCTRKCETSINDLLKNKGVCKTKDNNV